MKAYEYADLSQVYPIARGTAPLLVFLFSVLFLKTLFSMEEVIAIVAISTGVLMMTLKGQSQRKLSLRGVGFALLTAVFTASYSLVDGWGARVAQTASGFILWMVILDALIMLIYGVVIRKQVRLRSLFRVWKSGVSAGVMSLSAYWITVWAFTVAPIALVASLRESSILFATFIAALVLREPVSIWRWSSALCIVIGIIWMRV
ncbi:EamA family transporter [Celerinatantimonas sp. YJH-8]|uniref:EamA family transporter n=1 Tax=Celerinatantimonas sp. YJH-8 TaxID=3228714 RepID=UPI0038C62995